MEKVIIYFNAIIVTLVISVIFLAFYIAMFPIYFIGDIIILLVEAINGEEYYHNYSGRLFISFNNEIKKIYKKMIDEKNFND